jgi:hypothetical protein
MDPYLSVPCLTGDCDLNADVRWNDFLIYSSLFIDEWCAGATLEEGTGTTMPEDEDEPPIMEGAMDMGSDAHDMMGFGPLLPTDSERSFMERVRRELKIEHKQVRSHYY